MAMIELEEKTAALLRSQAQERNLPLNTFLLHLASATIPMNSEQPVPKADFESLMDSLAGDFPVLPTAFSRADIYDDHN